MESFPMADRSIFKYFTILELAGHVIQNGYITTELAGTEKTRTLSEICMAKGMKLQRIFLAK